MYRCLFDEFVASDDTLQVYNGNKLIFTSRKDGLRPLVEYIDSLALGYQEVVVFDKIMGHAAALLCAKANCREVHSPLGSRLAIKALDKYGIKHFLTAIVPYIKKAYTEEICPMEKLSLDKEPEEFYKLVRINYGPQTY